MKMDKKKQVRVFQTRQLETKGNCPASKVQKLNLQFHSAQFQSSFEVPGLIHLSGCFLTKRPRWWCIIAKVLLPSNKQTNNTFLIGMTNFQHFGELCVCDGKALSWAETCFYFMKLSLLRVFGREWKRPLASGYKTGMSPPLSVIRIGEPCFAYICHAFWPCLYR